MKFKLSYLTAVIGLGLTGLSHGAQMLDVEIKDARLLSKAKAIVNAGSGFTTKVSALVNDHMILGTAYNTDTFEFLNVQMVDGRVDETLGNTSVTTQLSNNSSYQEMLDKISGNVDIGVTFVDQAPLTTHLNPHKCRSEKEKKPSFYIKEVRGRAG